MSKEKTAKQLVDESSQRASKEWIDLLSKEDREFVYEVVRIIAENSGVSVEAVAEKLNEELKLDEHVDIISHELKELAAHE